MDRLLISTPCSTHYPLIFPNVRSLLLAHSSAPMSLCHHSMLAGTCTRFSCMGGVGMLDTHSIIKKKITLQPNEPFLGKLVKQFNDCPNYPKRGQALARDTFSFSHRAKLERFSRKWKNRRSIHLTTRRKYESEAVTDSSTDAGTDEGSEDAKEDLKEQSEDGQGDGRMTIVAGIGEYASKALGVGESLPPEGFILLLACAVGLMTGVGVVLFNVGVHELHDIVWDGIPSSGASWLRTRPLQENWLHIISVPAGGGVVVGVLNSFSNSLERSWDADTLEGSSEKTWAKGNTALWSELKAFLRPVIKTVAAAVTLATGNSLGPEGPSVEVGASIASGLGTALKNSRERKLSLIAAGSAAGISSGFNAAVSGCFFAVESVLRPSSADSAPSLTTAMVILSSVLASVVSQAGLGSDPAFKIPAYDFRSPAELPLYLVLGILCGFVSVGLTNCSSYSTSAFETIKRVTVVPAALLPPLGGLCVGVIALAYPEVLYWGFENVDVLLESRPFRKGPPAMLLLQLVGAKVVATSICRGSGLVGGVYAPSLFIGAALGSAYGKLVGYAVTHTDPMYHLDALKVAAPQAYALVGMAAMLAGVCQVPLTSVLLLFELTRDYRIIIPLMAAVGLSSWVASASTRKKQQAKLTYKPIESTYLEALPGSGVKLIGWQPQTGTSMKPVVSETEKLTESAQSTKEKSMEYTRSDNEDICTLDNSLCVASKEFNEEKLMDEIPVSAAMRTRFAAVSPDTKVHDVMDLMLVQKEWCVLLVGDGNILKGIVTLSDIQQGAERTKSDGLPKVGTLAVSAVCSSWATKDLGFPLVTVYPDMNLKVAWRLMVRRGLRQLPVIAREIYIRDKIKVVLGLLDRESIQLACRAEATRRLLGLSFSVNVSHGDGRHG